MRLFPFSYPLRCNFSKSFLIFQGCEFKVRTIQVVIRERIEYCSQLSDVHVLDGKKKLEVECNSFLLLPHPCFTGVCFYDSALVAFAAFCFPSSKISTDSSNFNLSFLLWNLKNKNNYTCVLSCLCSLNAKRFVWKYGVMVTVCDIFLFN